MRAIKSEIHCCSMKEVEKLLSLGRYHRSAVLLQMHSNDAWNTMKEQKKEDHQEVFRDFVRPCLELWASYVYVVHEGFMKIPVEDNKLNAIASLGDIRVLEIFRHNTFHYNPRYKSQQHSNLVNKRLVSWVQKLHDQHEVIVRRLGRLIATHPNLDNEARF